MAHLSTQVQSENNRNDQAAVIVLRERVFAMAPVGSTQPGQEVANGLTAAVGGVEHTIFLGWNKEAGSMMEKTLIVAALAVGAAVIYKYLK